MGKFQMAANARSVRICCLKYKNEFGPSRKNIYSPRIQAERKSLELPRMSFQSIKCRQCEGICCLK